MNGGLPGGDSLEAVLRPVIAFSTADEVAQQIGRIISDGYLKPGDKLPSEQEFARRLNVARSTIREAKQALAGQGLIELRGSRGAFVSGHVIARSAINRAIEELSSSVESDLYEARRIVEGAAAALGATRASAADLKGLEKLLVEIKEQSSSGSAPPAGHLRFHIALVETSHNQVLVGLYTQIAHLIENHLGPSYRFISEPTSEIASHRELLKALRGGDPDVAASAMRSHLDDVETRRQRAIRGELSGFSMES
jgi:GntR family transcriptional repressor for pyruvate dehydrogenase complex